MDSVERWGWIVETESTKTSDFREIGLVLRFLAGVELGMTRWSGLRWGGYFWSEGERLGYRKSFGRGWARMFFRFKSTWIKLMNMPSTTLGLFGFNFLMGIAGYWTRGNTLQERPS